MLFGLGGIIQVPVEAMVANLDLCWCVLYLAHIAATPGWVHLGLLLDPYFGVMFAKLGPCWLHVRRMLGPKIGPHGANRAKESVLKTSQKEEILGQKILPVQIKLHHRFSWHLQVTPQAHSLWTDLGSIAGKHLDTKAARSACIQGVEQLRQPFQLPPS